MTPYLIGLALLVLIALLVTMACARAGGLEKFSALLEAQAGKVRSEALARQMERTARERRNDMRQAGLN